MAEYIKKEDAVSVVLRQPFFQNSMATEIRQIKGIDIVRCKECDMSEVYQSDSNGVMARYCKAFTPTRMIADDDYCSYGERRE